jgi:hypothetical protein
MCPAGSRKVAVQALFVFALIVWASAFGIITAQAGLRGPGKYCGVVVFDRWDTCFLLSGPYITYISEGVKNELRKYQGKAMQVDASDVSQPMNPGDALIRKYEIVGPAPNTHRWVMLDGLELIAESDFGPRGVPSFLIEIRNVGSVPVQVDSSEIGPTLVGSSRRPLSSGSDGRSRAWITRGNLVHPSWWKCTVGGVTQSASYTIDPEWRPAERFQLEPDKSMKARVTFKVSPGQYQFMFGYGGGVHEEKSLASNGISFDINSYGFASLVE